MPTLSRRELYDLVWSTPMSKLAKTFGLSDVGLTKICDRHRIPTPPRGYWAKKGAGKKVKQAIFVEIDDPNLNSVSIASSTDRLPEPVREIIQQRRLERKAESPPDPKKEPQTAAIETVVDPHEAIRATVKALRSSKSQEGTTVDAIGPGFCGVSVSKDNVERLIVILDRLVRGCENRGLTLAPADTRMSVAADLDKLTFEIKEKTKRVPHVLTQAELAAQEKRRKRDERSARGFSASWEYIPTPPEYDQVRTGEFGLEIHGWGDGLRRSWNDGKTQKLENLIDGIIDGFEAHLISIRLRREKNERDKAERLELERRRGLAKARRERESQRKSLMNRILRSERQAVQLRVWLDKQGAGDRTVSDPDLDRMIAWARGQLHELDAFLDQQRLVGELRARELFPESDELNDPLGDPPPERRWW